jgi:hypothetical protein
MAMWWKSLASLKGAAILGAMLLLGAAAVAAPLAPPAKSPPARPLAPKIRAVDADNHNIILNKPDFISVIIGTSEDSQDAARRAGKAMYPFQGLSDFQMIVVVDLRDSIAAWVPSVVIDHMRRSLDQEAVEVKPYFLANGNKGNPRRSLHVIPDFDGKVVPLFNWSGTPDELHGTMYGADGSELKRWENIDDMVKFQSEVRAALQANSDAQAKIYAAQKLPLTKPAPAKP